MEPAKVLWFVGYGTTQSCPQTSRAGSPDRREERPSIGSKREGDLSVPNLPYHRPSADRFGLTMPFFKRITQSLGISSPETGLNPGRKGLATVGVLTVIPEEFEEIAPLLGASLNLPGTPYYIRPGQDPRNCDVVLASLDGRGNIKSANGTISLIDQFRPQYVLLAGIAGGVSGRDGTTVGDLVVPDFIDYYEMRKLVLGSSLRRCEPYDHPGVCVTNTSGLTYRTRP